MAQIVKRSAELENFSMADLETKAKVLKISTDQKNSCFLTKKGQFIKIINNLDNYLECHLFENYENLFTEPCDSSLFNIIFIKNLNRCRKFHVTRDELLRKVVCLPFEEGTACFPLLHDLNEICQS